MLLIDRWVTPSSDALRRLRLRACYFTRRHYHLLFWYRHMMSLHYCRKSLCAIWYCHGDYENRCRRSRAQKRYVEMSAGSGGGVTRARRVMPEERARGEGRGLCALVQRGLFVAIISSMRDVIRQPHAFPPLLLTIALRLHFYCRHYAMFIHYATYAIVAFIIRWLFFVILPHYRHTLYHIRRRCLRHTPFSTVRAVLLYACRHVAIRHALRGWY